MYNRSRERLYVRVSCATALKKNRAPVITNPPRRPAGPRRILGGGARFAPGAPGRAPFFDDRLLITVGRCHFGSAAARSSFHSARARSRLNSDLATAAFGSFSCRLKRKAKSFNFERSLPMFQRNRRVTSASLPLHFRFTSVSLPLHFSFTSASLRFTFASLPLHFCFTSASLPLHFRFISASIAPVSKNGARD